MTLGLERSAMLYAILLPVFFSAHVWSNKVG